MKQQLITAGDRIAPGVMARVRSRRVASRAVLAQQSAALRDDVTRLDAQLQELRAELDETRRDNIRLTELTDIVENRLAGRG